MGFPFWGVLESWGLLLFVGVDWRDAIWFGLVWFARFGGREEWDVLRWLGGRGRVGKGGLVLAFADLVEGVVRWS